MLPVPRSLPRLCIALGYPNAAELGQAAEQEYKDGSKFFEFRLDHLKEPSSGLELIKKFTSGHSDVHVLATCRHRNAHGCFGGTIEQQITLLRASAKAGATLLDLEIESAEKVRSEAAGLRHSALLVVSYHNFRNTPSLDPVLRRLRKIPADIYKVATTARKPSDNLRVLDSIRDAAARAPFVAFAMSEEGAASRILSPSLGCVFTFAAPNSGPGTAPGQISARALRQLYRPEKLSRESRLFGVIADPVAHSKSPVIHNRAFHARRVDAVYLPFLVAPKYLGDWMKVAAELPVAGFSVTIPHKRRILRYIDLLEPIARRIGAVNTVWRKAGKWRGTNTDTEGVLRPLSRHLRLANSTVLVAGYGGAARAAAIALCDAGAKVTITGRDHKKASLLARAAKGEFMTLHEAELGEFDALVQATPVGMFPRADGCLFQERVPAGVVLDMVYNPVDTVLLQRARKQGAVVIPGSEMLLEQAAAQFEIWTGESAPRDVMRSALEQSL